MRRATLAALATGAVALSACGGGDGTGNAAPSESASSDPADSSPLDTGPDATPPLDMVIFVTTPTTTTTTTTTLPPPTTTSSTTTTSTTTSTSTSTTTTEPPVALVRCSFAADALFEPGEAVLTTDAVDALGELADDLTDDPDAELRSVAVEGHTDHRGSEDDNLALSEARASAAAAVLIDAGIDAAIITVVGHGEEFATQPAGDATPSEDEMADDRRVDILIDADVTISTGC